MRRLTLPEGRDQAREFCTPIAGAGLFLRQMGSILDIARADPVQKFDHPATVFACCRPSVRSFRICKATLVPSAIKSYSAYPFGRNTRAPLSPAAPEGALPLAQPWVVRCDRRQKTTLRRHHLHLARNCSRRVTFFFVASRRPGKAAVSASAGLFAGIPYSNRSRRTSQSLIRNSMNDVIVMRACG